MEITDEHRKRARQQFGAVLDPDDDDRLIPSPARVGYLAAVERIDTTDGTDPTTTGQDVEGRWLDMWLNGNGTVVLEMQGKTEPAHEHEGCCQVLSPDELRRRCFDGLVLADLAEGSGGTER